VEWWQKAAIQGHAFAQLSLGQAYRDGEGVPKDAVKAVDWLEKSAAQGLTVSQMILGEVYADGNGVLADSVLAYAWMNLASGNGFDVADESRDRVARRMTTFELAEAQRLSSNWKEGQILVREGANKSTAGTTASGNLRKQGNGTIFVVSKAGHAITNQHVTTGCIELRIQGREGVAKLITEDAFNDLALVQIPTPVTDAATVASDPGQLRQGEDVVVFGFPLTSLLSSGGNLTPGVVSALTGLGNNTNQIQITAPIQPGSSGSPVLNKKGEVIGVVSLKLSDLKMVTATGSVGQNVNFAVSGQTLKTFLNTNKVTYSTGGFFSRDKSTADLADEARKWTMVIECWRQ
jgi:S1-C subfamily serine protease